LRTRDPHTSTLGPQSGNADGHLPAPIAAGGSSTKSVFPMVRIPKRVRSASFTSGWSRRASAMARYSAASIAMGKYTRDGCRVSTLRMSSRRSRIGRVWIPPSTRGIHCGPDMLPLPRLLGHRNGRL
jgi:hypothetical protein